MRKIMICFLSLAVLAAIAGAASALRANAASQSPHSYRTVIRLSGDEYSDAQNNVLNHPRGTKCSARPGSSALGGCWTWTAKHLGHGAYTISQPTLQGAQLVWSFSYTDTRGDSLIGTLTERYIPDPSPSDALTHANRYPATYTVTGGTGRFAGGTGVLNATATRTTVSVSPPTGVAHTKYASTAAGMLTFPSKL
jgi:hypothetical protein